MSGDAVTLDTLIVRKDAVAAADLDGETVVLDVDSGAYYAYDAVASRIWRLLEEPRTVRGLCDVLHERYEVEPERCRSEVLAFVTELAGHGLVRAATGGHGETPPA